MGETLDECLRARISISSGQIFSDSISSPVGYRISGWAQRARLHPSHLTLCGLAVGIGSSVAIAHAYSTRNLALQMLAVLGFQIAYIFDCADGQLARRTDRASVAGAELDVFVDFAVQASMLVATSQVAVQSAGASAWLVAAHSSLWIVSVVSTLVARLRMDRWDSTSLRPSSHFIRMSRQLRDYPLAVLVVSVSAAFAPRTSLPAVIGFFTAVNLMALILLIGSRAKQGLQGQ